MQLYKAEYKPTWRLIDEIMPPIGTKVLFKSKHGPAVIGIYYAESGWDYWCPLPSHSTAQKQKHNQVN
jgi:hypothetical protein